MQVLGSMDPPKARRTNWWHPAGAIVGGVCLGLAFPPTGWTLLAPVGVACITAVCLTSRLRGALAWSGLAGLVSFLIILRWVSLVGYEAWVFLGFYGGAWIALVGVATWCVRRLPFWPVWVATIWVLDEALRGRFPTGGWSWGRLAFSQADAPTAGYIAVGGAPLLTFVVSLIGAMLAWLTLYLVQDRRQRQHHPSKSDESPRTPFNLWLAAGCAGGIIAIWLAGLAIPRPTNAQLDDGPATTRVAVVQAKVATGGSKKERQRQVIGNHVQATLNLARSIADGGTPAPEIVIWPENSVDIDPFRSIETAELISQAADAVDAPILVGAVIVAPNNEDQRANVTIVWNPRTGPGEMYVKRHPLPFGEYVPGRQLLTRFISKFDQIPHDFIAGDIPGVLQAGEVRLGAIICYEIVDDAVVRDTVTGGGRMLAVQANNTPHIGTGWFGSGEPEQFEAMAVLRAIEHGRTTAVSATTGRTVVLNPAGEEIAAAPMGAEAWLVEDVPLRNSLTIADRVGAWPEWIIVGAAIAAIAMGIARGLRQ